MKKLVTLFLFLAMSAVAIAATGESHDEHIPFDKIGWQAANLGILLLIIFFSMKKSIVDSFAKRQADFVAQSEKTKASLNQAEAELREVKEKLALLETGEAKSIENAKHEANLTRAHMIRDAEALAEKMKTDAELTIKNELVKAKAEINQIILNEAVVAAKAKLATTPSKSIEAQFLSQVDKSPAPKATL